MGPPARAPPPPAVAWGLWANAGCGRGTASSPGPPADPHTPSHSPVSGTYPEQEPQLGRDHGCGSPEL